ncbi:MAG: penicillin-binding transpeptidase domain-containing protein [Oscillospiraceae bacterium]|nr:penicillin-binding transpeptidase domain-containing protein [Oscillospiraceae bacterium]
MKFYRRILGVYTVVAMLFAFAIFRVYTVATSDNLMSVGGSQGTYRMDVAKTRGAIYDRNMNPLVNRGHRYLASVVPTIQAAGALLDGKEGEERGSLADMLRGTAPFVLEVEDENIYAAGVDVFRVPVRYGENQVAPHIIGYLSGDGVSGAAGIEKAYDSFLAETGMQITRSYRVDAAGRAMTGGGFGVERSGSREGAGGVVLTIDASIQELAQNALAEAGEKGAAVVLDIATGDILAMASLPVFDPADIAASFDSADAPFINRAVSGFNIGSVFKLVISAAALEMGIPASYSYNCTGSVTADGVSFRCNNHAVHGYIDMARALQVSCNTYYITLAQEIPPAFVLSVAENLGLGASAELADGMFTARGNLPSEAELSNAAAYANFSFGQGSSLASPLQMAVAVAQIANQGMSAPPRLIRGFTLDGTDMAEEIPFYGRSRVLSERTSARLRELMVSVVEEGSGRTAKPHQGSAGGKTSSAQTGSFIGGREVVHAWFAGFYPAAAPKYAICVFVEGGQSGESAAAPVFRKIADGLRQD